MRIPARLAGVLAVTLLVAMPLVEGLAATNHKIRVEAGQQQQLSAGGHDFLVNTSEPIILYLEIEGEAIDGLVEPARDSSGEASVEIYKVGPPDDLLFKGTIDEPTPFDDVYPHETGHAEM